MISIIVPFYHGNKYMHRLLTDLKNNYTVLNGITDMELVLINDSPEDDILVDAENWPFSIRIYNNPRNEGIQKSRINGIKHSNGDYILMLDQDDSIEENCLKSQYLNIGDNDFIVSNGYQVYSENHEELIYGSESIQDACLHYSTYVYYKNLIVSPGQVLIRKSVIPVAWMNNPFKYNGADDAYLWILLLKSNKKGVCNSDALYRHIFTGENTSLNIQGMMNSQTELNRALKGILKPLELNFMKRRSHYNSFYNDGLRYKLKYLDICIVRGFYRIKMK